MTSGKVLVLGDDTRSFLSTVRSLGRHGLQVHVCPFNFQAPALKSRYITKVHWLPYYLGIGDEWKNAITRLLRTENFDLVIPCDERTLLPMHWHRDDLGMLTKLAIPPVDCIEPFFDKCETRSLASSLGIPVAKGGKLLPDTKADQLISEIGLPIAIKPSASFTAERLYSRNKVTIAHDKASLHAALDDVKHQSHIYESFFPGDGLGVSVLVHNGRILQAFEHHRIHEFAGVSHYRVSALLTPMFMDAVQKIMLATHYTGVAMTEFRLNRETNEWILLEINARPWGSLPLPVGLGVDFPYAWYQLLCNGVEITSTNYRTGVYGRNLVPDTRLVLSHLRALSQKPSSLAKFSLVTAGEYLRIFKRREIHDVFVTDDINPSLQEMLIVLGDVLNRVYTKLSILNRLRDRYSLKSETQRKLITEVAVVCQGNICRSPFAAKLLEKFISNAGMDHIKIESYGNLPREGISSPENAIQAAESHGIDLSEHRSRHFSREAASVAQVIIIFDETNRRWIHERYPTLKTPILLLGSFGSNERIIKDPDGRNQDFFENTYQLIAEATAGLAKKLSNGYTSRVRT